MINFEWQAKPQPPVRGIVLERQAEIDPVRRLLACADTISSLKLLNHIDEEIMANRGLQPQDLAPFDTPDHVLGFYMRQTLTSAQSDAMLDKLPIIKNVTENIELPQIILEGYSYNQFRSNLGKVLLAGIGLRDKRRIKNQTGSSYSHSDAVVLEDMKKKADWCVLSVDCPMYMERYVANPYIVNGNPKDWLERRFNIIVDSALQLKEQ